MERAPFWRFGKPLANSSIAQKTGLLAGLVFCLALAAYLIVPNDLASNDNYSHGLTALSITRGEWGYLDELQPYWASPILEHRCTIIETNNGKIVAGTGFGVALAITPIYALARLFGAANEVVLADTFNFFLAAIFTALAVALFSSGIHRLRETSVTVFSTIAFGFGTSLFSVLSRELWQHTLVVALFAGVFFLLFRPPDQIKTRALLLAGFFAGWAAAARATGFIFILPLLWLAVRLVGRRSGWLALGFSPWIALTMAYNWLCFGNPFTLGQFIIGQVRFAQPGAAQLPFKPLAALAGLLFSPGRGLFIYSPVLLLCVVLPVLLFKKEKSLGDRAGEKKLILPWLIIRPWLGPAAVIVAFNVLGASTWKEWAAGWTYGPRYLADPLVFWGVLLAATLLAVRGARLGVRRLIFLIAWPLLLLSITFHGAGLLVNPYKAESFSARMDPDRHPERMWLWTHFPPLYNLRLWRGQPPPKVPYP